MSKQQLLKALDLYQTRFPEEQTVVSAMQAFLKQHTDAFQRECVPGHMTASAWLINPKQDQALLTHHRKLNCWLQLGGHADGEEDLTQVALREAQEESGILDIKLLSTDIFDIDIHEIPKYGDTPAHLHYDVRYLLQAANMDAHISAESNDLQWFAVNGLQQLDIDHSVQRLVDKWQSLKQTV